jgi:hypothetical protein
MNEPYNYLCDLKKRTSMLGGGESSSSFYIVVTGLGIKYTNYSKVSCKSSGDSCINWDHQTAR